MAQRSRRWSVVVGAKIDRSRQEHAMNKPMDEQDKRFRDAQQGQEGKRGGQQSGGAPKPQQGQGDEAGQQRGEQGEFKKKS
jgi:hypothetical protein